MTTREQIINDLYQGKLVQVDREEYVEWARTAIQEQAGRWIEQGDGIRANIALSEVRRLDKINAEITCVCGHLRRDHIPTYEEGAARPGECNECSCAGFKPSSENPTNAVPTAAGPENERS